MLLNIRCLRFIQCFIFPALLGTTPQNNQLGKGIFFCKFIQTKTLKNHMYKTVRNLWWIRWDLQSRPRPFQTSAEGSGSLSCWKMAVFIHTSEWWVLLEGSPPLHRSTLELWQGPSGSWLPPRPSTPLPPVLKARVLKVSKVYRRALEPACRSVSCCALPPWTYHRWTPAKPQKRLGMDLSSTAEADNAHVRVISERFCSC